MSNNSLIGGGGNSLVLELMEQIKLLKEENELLKQNFDIHSGTVNIDSQYQTYVNQYIKYGKLCHLNVYIDKGGETFAASRFHLGTIQENLHPSIYIICPISAQTILNGGQDQYAELVITREGIVFIDNPVSNIKRFFINVTYITNSFD